jgi:hypothetical protein
MIIQYDADRQWKALASEELASGRQLGALPRQTQYGSSPGLAPFGDFANLLVNPDDFKSVIEQCHASKIFPQYHQKATWGPPGFKWMQNGLPYCWAWSLTACLMDARAREGKQTVLLAPTSLGFTVGWKSRGNYLESGIQGATERGIASAACVPDPYSINPSTFKEGWEADALNYRISPGDTWDLDNGSKASMIQHAISVLATGCPLYVAYNWWGHAVSCVGIRWDESKPFNIVWVIRNSHNEDDFIELTGNKGVPSEAYGIRATAT